MTKKYALSLIFLALLSSALFGQINATVNANGAQLAQVMSGPGVIISNVQLNCPTGAAGTFSCPNCSLNMDSGIVLTNGYVSNIAGPNNQVGATGAWGVTGTSPADTDLANLIGEPVTELFDACILEFDLTVQSDSVQFKYIFGSEEYPEYTCSQFNDAFAFFISGPGISGEKNIALIPGTTIPVTINSVNQGSPGVDAGGGTCNGVNQSLANSQYYVNNGTGNNAPYNANPYYIQYNGFTTTLVAGAGGLDVCSVYHLKLIIADVIDATFDSGVFIQANSLSSNLVTLGPVGTTVPGIDSAVRGCVDGIFTFQFEKPVTTNTTVHYTLAGTAVNGTDYTQLPDSVVFLAGDSTEQITIHPIGNATQPLSVVLSLGSLCGTIYDSSVLYIAAPYQFVTGPDTTICPGDTVQLYANAGVPASLYIWQPGTDINNPVLQNPLVYPTDTTTYTCTATIGGCHYVDSVKVSVYTTPPFSVSAGPDILACAGSPVQLNAVVSGTPITGHPFVYDWVPANGLSNSSIANPVDNPAVNDTFVVFVTSGHCSVSDTVSVTIDNITETMSSTAASCSYSSNGTATATVNTGIAPYTYNWTGGATNATAPGLAAGLYHVTITDHADCTATDTVTVYAPSPITFGTPTVTPVSCVGGNNGTATITATGGTGNITFAWSSGSNTATASNLTAGNYTVTATDGNACTATTTVVVSTLPALTDSVAITNVSCFGGSNGTATALSTGGTAPYGYVWSSGPTTGTITGLPAGPYGEVVTDAAGCTASASATVGQAPLLVANELSDNVSCFGQSSGSITVSITGGTTPYSFLWNDGNTAQSRNNLAIGYYKESITDANGCSDTISATITQPTALVLTDSIVNVVCYGASNGAVYLTVSGGTPPYSYNWGIGITSQNATNIPADTYYPSVTDNLGCLITTSANLAPYPQIVFGDSVVTNVSCFGGSNGVAHVYPFGGEGAFTYTWNGQAGNNPDSSLSAATYNVIVTDTNHCTAAENVVVGQPPVLALAINEHDALCYDGADGNAIDIVTGGTPPYKYIWSDGQTKDTASGLLAGTYQSTVTDNGGCTASSSTLIGQAAQILFSVDSTPVKCVGTATGTLTLNVSAGGVPPFTYAATKDPSIFITTTDSVIQELDTGYYTVQISDNNGCVVLTTAYVPNAIPDSFNITTDSTSCFGPHYTDGAIHVAGLVAQNTPYQYSVDGGPFQFSGDFTNLAGGSHNISITNFNGCLTDTTAVIGVPIAGVADVNPTDTTIQLGESIQLFSSFLNYPPSSIVSYNWVPSVGLSCVDCPAPVVSTYSHINTYTVTITYNNGCMASDSARVIVVGTPPFYIPNSFTPNGDGTNDMFLIYGESIKTVSLKIFNRWGEKVFDSESQFLGWDGNYKGQPQMPGVYVYEAQITFLDNTQTLRTGSITLIR